MTLAEYIAYKKNSLAELKPRILITSSEMEWCSIRSFYLDYSCSEIRVSSLINETDRLPVPSELFERLSEKLTAVKDSTPVVVLGLQGYLSLISVGHKKTVFSLLRKYIDETTSREVVFLLFDRGDIMLLLWEVFQNPRYQQARQLVVIDAEQFPFKLFAKSSSKLNITDENDKIFAGVAEVMLVDIEMADLIPESCDTFQKFLHYTEEYPTDKSARKIVVAAKGREVAGVSADVQQIMKIRDFAREFYKIEGDKLSENALKWLCTLGKNDSSKTISSVLMDRFFSGKSLQIFILSVFDSENSIEKEALLWFVQRVAPKGSYLEFVASLADVTVDNFRSAYVTSALLIIGRSSEFASERAQAIRAATSLTLEGDVLQFISKCHLERTVAVVPWLNCNFWCEKIELLRRCFADEIVPSSVREGYTELKDYLYNVKIFEDNDLNNYFEEYRMLKATNRLSVDFYMRAKHCQMPHGIKTRDSILQNFSADENTVLLVVDALGVEWLPMLIAVADRRNIGIESVAVGLAHLPTSTLFNKVFWPDSDRRMKEIKSLDNIAHNGVEVHENRLPEENFAASLNVVSNKVMVKVVEALANHERVVLTSDHGTSRLAAIAYQIEPRMAQVVDTEEGAMIADWRYREKGVGPCPDSLEETLDGKYWVIKGYDRFVKKGGGQGFEVHGGSSLEERLVPIVVFSRKGQYMPKSYKDAKRPQLVTNDGFDF